jgi:S-DNA-T family DNA segregation ATPase FtsK/SpoIIIE
LQCPFVDTPEVEDIAKYIGEQRGFPVPYELPEYVDPKDAGNSDRTIDFGERDELFTEAARLIVRNQIGSTSLIQRKLALGYARSGRLMDQLENAGIVGPNLGSKAREVYIKTDEELERILLL